VWAREMDAGHNQALIAYFHARSVWLLEPDSPSKKLTPYPGLSRHELSGAIVAR
jgi:hypothetical protein